MTREFKFSGQGTLVSVESFDTKKGGKIYTLVLETDDKYAQFVPVKLLGRIAERIAEFGNGDLLAITGTLGGRQWNGKYYGDIVADTVEILTKADVPLVANPAAPPPGDDDLPF